VGRSTSRRIYSIIREGCNRCSLFTIPEGFLPRSSAPPRSMAQFCRGPQAAWSSSTYRFLLCSNAARGLSRARSYGLQNLSELLKVKSSLRNFIQSGRRRNAAAVPSVSKWGRNEYIPLSGARWPAIHKTPRSRAILDSNQLRTINVLPAVGDTNHWLWAFKHFPHHRCISHTALAELPHQRIGTIRRHRDEQPA
jgi:hypothetical protein